MVHLDDCVYEWLAAWHSGVRRTNEVNARWARLVLELGDHLRAGIPSRNVPRQLGQLGLASLRGRLIEYQLRLG